MARVISLHHYKLKPGVSDRSFMQAVKQAQAAKLFELPGLESYHFMKGIKGDLQSKWTAVWIYSSRSAWEKVWGTRSDPKPKDQYPERWKHWEDELLTPLLNVTPDAIEFTAYEEVITSIDPVEG